MTEPSRDDLHATIGQIYQAAYDATLWPDAMNTLRNLFNGSRACLCRAGPNLQPSDTVASNSDAYFDRLYCNDFTDEIPALVQAVQNAPAGLVYAGNMMHGEALTQTRFWNDWMVPQDMYGGASSKILSSGPSVWFVDVQRGKNQDTIGGTEAEMFEIIARHMRRAVEIGQKFQTRGALSSASSLLPFGVILVDRFLRIVAQNEMAETFMLRPGGALGRRAGRLFLKNAQSNDLLKKLVRDACSPSFISPRGAGGDFLVNERRAGYESVRFSISVGPLTRTDAHSMFVEPCAVVAIREMSFELRSGFIDRVEVLFNLPRKKAELAALLASGRSLKDAASEQGIKFSSARKYLEDIFEKTATHQQTQLVALLKSIEPMFPTKM
jgi:DNA-binding CsgD family transcriptional regulator